MKNHESQYPHLANSDIDKRETSPPLVSVIALCYNQSHFVKTTLDSINKQTYSSLELIIIDDFSNDNSVQLINDWIESNNVKANFLRHSENRGICKSLNEGLANCQGKYVQFIACDDILLPDKIDSQVCLMEKFSNQVAMVYSDANLIDENGLKIEGSFIKRQREFRSLPEGYIYETLLGGNFIPPMAVLYRKNSIEEIGGFDENIRYEDYDLLLRISRKYEIKADPTVLTKYRVHSRNFEKLYSHYFEVNYFIWIKHLHFAPMLRMARDTVRNLYLNGNRQHRVYENALDNKFSLFNGTYEKVFFVYNIPPLFLRIWIKLARIVGMLRKVFSSVSQIE